MKFVLLIFLRLATLNPMLAANTANTNVPPEHWLSGTVVYPPPLTNVVISSNCFASLRADYLAETLKISWSPSQMESNSVLWISMDEPGHWPVRDWHSFPMTDKGSVHESLITVDSLDSPMVYFVKTLQNGKPIISPMRLCRLRLLGMEKPTGIFWPFVEGFEEGMESWRWLDGNPNDDAFVLSTPVRNGKKALSLTIPAQKTSISIGTTRFRGWYLMEHGAKGIALWMRTRQGNGQARFQLFANAYDTNQIIAVSTNMPALAPEWKKIELPLKEFPRFPIHNLDFFTIELIGKPGTEFLIDDLQLLGSWIFN